MSDTTAITVKVKLLGTFDVIRPDGSAVAPTEWRTRKTMDLLRLLALAAGRPVRTASLLEKLWPRASAERGQGSLRTATTQIRRAIGVNCVARHPEGLVLTPATVDVLDFLALARDLHLLAREDRHQDVVRMARSAEALYGGDFHASDDDSPWARGERHRLRAARIGMLAEASHCANTLGMHREARDLARVAVELDPTSEAPLRALMHAHAELGEVGTALRAFESFRTHLADELGADPSRQTRELHLQLLRGGSGGQRLAP